MPQAKYGLKLGGRAKDVVVTAGTAIAGGDAIELNVDYSRTTKNDVIAALKDIQDAVAMKPFPPL